MRLNRIAAVVTSIAALGGASVAPAAEPPVLKSGLWEVVATTPQQAGHKQLTTMCLDVSVQAEMREFLMGAAKSMCTENERSFDGTRMVTTAVCKMGATTVTNKSVMTFKGNTEYHTEGSMTYDPPIMNMKESKLSSDAKWTGPCKAGQQPGDMTIEGGQTINIKSLMNK